MDWNAAIEKNREALKRVLALLVGLAGLTGQSAFLPQDGASSQGPAEGSPALPRHLHRFVLRLLRPAEAAARRLVIVAARDLVMPPPRPRKPKPRPYPIFMRPGEMRTGIVLPRGVRPSAILPALARPAPAGWPCRCSTGFPASAAAAAGRRLAECRAFRCPAMGSRSRSRLRRCPAT